MMRCIFFVAGTPVPQGSKRAYRRGSKIVLVESSADTLGPWRDALAQAARRARPDGWPVAGPFRVILEFSFARPKAHFTSAGLRPGAPTEKETRPDGDKLERAVLDALTGVLFGDDAQVVFMSWTKIYGDQPGVTVTVRPGVLG